MFQKISLFYFHVIENQWKKVWFRTCLLLLNKNFVRSLRATRAREHLKLSAHLLSSYEYLVNLSISVAVLRAYALH